MNVFKIFYLYGDLLYRDDGFDTKLLSLYYGNKISYFFSMEHCISCISINAAEETPSVLFPLLVSVPTSKCQVKCLHLSARIRLFAPAQ